MEDLSAARHFCSAKILAAGCDGGRGSSSQRGKSPRKEISRGNLLFAESGLTNLSYPPIIERSKVREHAQLVQPSAPGSSGVQEGQHPSVSERVQRKPFEGFSLVNFFLTADAVLLCAAKKNGVGTRTSWHVTPEAYWPYLATAGSRKTRPWQALPKQKTPPWRSVHENSNRLY